MHAVTPIPIHHAINKEKINSFKNDPANSVPRKLLFQVIVNICKLYCKHLQQMYSQKLLGYLKDSYFLKHLQKCNFFILPPVFHQARGQKRKHGIGGKFFTCFIESQTSLTSSKGRLKLIKYKCLHHNLRICFYLEKEVTIPVFYFRKTNFN